MALVINALPTVLMALSPSVSVGIVDVLQSVQIGRNDDHAHVLSLALRQLLRNWR
ncbi:MAG: hypothetical protein ACLT29_05190 [Ruminococcus callidus]